MGSLVRAVFSLTPITIFSVFFSSSVQVLLSFTQNLVACASALSTCVPSGKFCHPTCQLVPWELKKSLDKKVMLNSRPWAEEGLSSKFRDVLSSRLFEAIELSTLA